MKRAALILAALAAILSAAAAPVRTATETFVTNKIAEAVAAIPAPDMSAKQDALPYPTNAIPYEAIAGKPGGMTTNAVCAIVTNTVTTEEWIYTGLPDGAQIYYPPVYMGDEWWSCVMSYNGDNYDGSWYGPEDSTFMTFKFVNVTSFGGEDYIATAEHRITESNALGLAREKDLPQKSPVDEILLNGADGKVYHLRIGAGGSIDIYTEVTQ